MKFITSYECMNKIIYFSISIHFFLNVVVVVVIVGMDDDDTDDTAG